MPKRTSRPIRRAKPEATYSMWGFGLVIVGLSAGGLAASVFGLPTAHRKPLQATTYVSAPVATSTAEPAPTATSVPKPLSLVLSLPDLDPDQQYWFHRAQIVSLCPSCAGLDMPAISMSQNALTVWLALIWTESRYQPWAVSSSGCYGLGQLCGSLETADTDADPVLNLYVSLREFSRLLGETDGEIMEALKSYKGVTTWDTESQANSVWSYIRVGE